MADTQMCPYYLAGHCNKKAKCTLSHDIFNCNDGTFCKNKKSCQFRHVKLCPLHPRCYFKKCSYKHPLLPPHIPYHSLHYPPATHLPVPPPTHPPHLPIKQELTKLKAEFLESTTKLNSKIQSLETEMAAIKQTSSVERQESVMIVRALEAYPPTNQKNEQDGKSCLDVTNRKKH